MAVQQQVEMRTVSVNSTQSRPISHSIASTTSNQSRHPQPVNTYVEYNNQQPVYQSPESVRSFSVASAQSIQSTQSNPKIIYAVPTYPVQTKDETVQQQPQTKDDEIVSVLVELEEELEKPNKWIALLWFVWNTFDLLTDIILGVEWFHGIKTSLSQTSACADSENTILKICGIAMMIAGVIGYFCYLFDTYRLIKGKERVTKDGCNCFRLSKLVFEDLLSIMLTCIITLQLFQLTTWTIISLGMSSISFVFIMFKEAVVDPCRNKHKCHACLCIFIWLFIVGFLIFFAYQVSRSYTSATTDYGMRIIMIEDECYTMDDPTDEFDTYSYIHWIAIDYSSTSSINVNDEIYCYYQHVNISDTVVCTQELYENGYPDPLTSALTVLQYPSCDTISILDGWNDYRDRLVCYDGISLNTKVDSALIADNAKKATNI